jgi:hypothetical protein
MFYRGGMSPTGYWNRDGWFGRGSVLGAADTECNGDTCVIIAQRLTPDQAKASYDKMKYAVANKPSCMTSVSDSMAAKLEKAVLGIETTAPLTKSEVDSLAQFEACIGIIPSNAPIPNVPVVPSAVSTGIPTSTLIIGAGALAVLVAVLAAVK